PAQARGRYIVTELRRDPEGGLHRVRDDVAIGEGTEDLVGRPHLEPSGDRRRQEVFEGRGAGRGAVRNRPMADLTTDPVPGERAVLELRVGTVGELDEVELEVAVPPDVGVELSLAHRPVAGQAEIPDLGGQLLAPGRRQRLEVGKLALQLRVED